MCGGLAFPLVCLTHACVTQCVIESQNGLGLSILALDTSKHGPATTSGVEHRQRRNKLGNSKQYFMRVL